tara:strand:+ start:3792 stop:5072 length:1281 start_codon:yes stop_codon:yes gene_type:complete
MRKTTRQLQHSKSSKVQVGTGAPSNTEGQSGDLTLRLTKSGIKLFAKFRDKWYLVGQGNLNQLGGDKQDQIFSDNLEKVTAVEKKGKIKVKADDRGGLELFPWTIRSRKFQSGWGSDEKGFVIEQIDGSRSFGIFENGEVTFEDSSGAMRPYFTLKNSQNNQIGPALNFFHDDADPILTSSGIGTIQWDGRNDAGERVEYGRIQLDVKDIADGDERGAMRLMVTDEDQGNTGIVIRAHDPSNESYVQFMNSDIWVGGRKVGLGGVATDSHIQEASADVVTHTVGGKAMLTLTEGVDDTGISTINHAKNAIIGDAVTPTYNATNTGVFFWSSNYHQLTFGSGSITNLNLFFPDGSGHFTLLIKQDGTGSRTITNYKTFDQAAGNESTLKFSGGSNPTLTTAAGKVDMFRIYWDNINHIAYATVDLNF